MSILEERLRKLVNTVSQAHSLSSNQVDLLTTILRDFWNETGASNQKLIIARDQIRGVTVEPNSHVTRVPLTVSERLIIVELAREAQRFANRSPLLDLLSLKILFCACQIDSAKRSQLKSYIQGTHAVEPVFRSLFETPEQRIKSVKKAARERAVKRWHSRLKDRVDVISQSDNEPVIPAPLVIQSGSEGGT